MRSSIQDTLSVKPENGVTIHHPFKDAKRQVDSDGGVIQSGSRKRFDVVFLKVEAHGCAPLHQLRI
jgi:hypothetical protein